MISNKKRLHNAKLYLILDAQVLDGKALMKALKVAVRRGVDIVQLRNKNGSARDVLAFCREALPVTRNRALFILNDRCDLAQIAKVDGVHVGQEDIPYYQARQLLGPKAIIGVSCQNLAQAKQAQREGADYIGFGSVFKTQTKPERNPMDLKMLRRVLHEIKTPVFPIGGICRGNIGLLKEVQVSRIAVCRDILLADKPGEAIEEFKRFFE